MVQSSVAAKSAPVTVVLDVIAPLVVTLAQLIAADEDILSPSIDPFTVSVMSEKFVFNSSASITLPFANVFVIVIVPIEQHLSFY